MERFFYYIVLITKFNNMKSLKELRKMNGHTLNVLKDKTGVTQANLSLIENGLSVPNNGTRNDLERFFGEPINFLATLKIKTSPRYPTTFRDAEGDFRRFYRTAAGLPENVRNEFIKTCIVHLKKLEKSKVYISEPE